MVQKSILIPILKIDIKDKIIISKNMKSLRSKSKSILKLFLLITKMESNNI